MNDYTIIYQTGGRLNYKWHRTGLTGNHEQMKAEQADLARRGYPSYIVKRRELETIGMPDNGDGTNTEYFREVINGVQR